MVSPVLCIQGLGSDVNLVTSVCGVHNESCLSMVMLEKTCG